MKEIVKYHNSMNKISFAGFTEKELDIFFGLCFKLKENYSNEVVLTFGELNKLIGNENNKALIKRYIRNLGKKVGGIQQEIEIGENIWELFTVFNAFQMNFNDKTLTVSVNPKLELILNNLISNYTKFELHEFISLKSVYSKNTYKLLKQFDSTGVREISLTEYKELVGSPESYTIDILNKRVFKYVLEELPQYFENLKMEKIKTGRTITKLRFTWKKKESKHIPVEKLDYKGLTMTEGEIQTIIALNLQNERDWLIKIKTFDYKAYENWKYYKNIERSDYDILMFWHKLKTDKIVENVTKIVPRWEREPKEEIQSEFIDYDISWLTEE